MEATRPDFWQGRRVFVTGCSGFLGGWLTDALVEAGAAVVGLVRDQVPDSHLMASGLDRRITIVHGELEDAPLLRRAIGEYEIETVFHLAAQPIVGVAHCNPVATFEVNIRGTWNLLEACRETSTLKGLVIASSDKAYGDQRDLPYKEELPLQGGHPYDVSKSCADLIAAAYYKTYGLPVAITRCANLFGPGDLNFNRILPGTVRSALQGERPIIRSDGSPIRDYIFVKDVVNAYLLVARRLDDPEVQGEAFNFGTATPVSVLELTSRILQIMKREDLEPVILDEVQGEIRDQYLSSDKAKRVLGWEPATSLDEGLAETIGWYRRLLSSDGVG